MTASDTNEKKAAAREGVLDTFFRRILFAKDMEIPPPVEKHVKARDVLSIYGESVWKHPVTIALVLSSVVASSVIAVVSPLYYKDFFDILTRGGESMGRSGELRHIIVLILGLGLFNFVAWRTAHFANQFLASRVVADLRERAFAHLIHHSQRFFTSTFTGTLVQRVNRFANGYDRIADRVIYDIIPIVVQVAGVLWILAREEKTMAVIVLLWTALFLAVNYVFARWKLKYDIAGAAQDSKTTGTLADIITNQSAVEAHGSHEFEKLRYGYQVETQMHMNRFRWNLAQSFDSIQSLFIVFVEFAVFYVGIGLWEKGQFSVGTFVLVQAYIVRLSGQLWSFSRLIRDVYDSFADAKEMTEIMQTPHEIEDAPEARTITRARGDVRFDHVSFCYNAQTIIDDFTTTMKAGERVALVGPSGAGKSTIVKLLFRFYDPTGGDVAIDGTSIRELSLDSLRQTLSLVPQDPALFHRSLMENIRYGRPGATDEEVLYAAKLAHCDEFIDLLPAKYDTLVGERGIKLSGGERQRVALARAFLRNAPIIMLDEATSSLDSESERYIQQALEELMKGRTTIVIAHRLSTIRSMDRIIVMDKGRIIEDGPHETLLTKKGLYAKLWNLQQNGFIPLEVLASLNAKDAPA